MADKQVRFGIKVAQMTGTYDGIQDAWLEADRLGFDTAWGHDHLLNQKCSTGSTLRVSCREPNSDSSLQVRPRSRQDLSSTHSVACACYQSSSETHN